MKKLCLFLVLFMGRLCGTDVSPSMNIQPIHEAFIQRITDPVPLEIISKRPPALLQENAIQAPNTQTIWIPGYWTWIREKKDFAWVCGVWRLPPPDHVWSTGYWTEANGGWVWAKGAWMPDQAKNQSKWTYSKSPPPSSQNEETGQIPGQDNFWSSGYWNYSSATSQFEWLSGSWQKFNPNWVFECAHWIWRPEGYLFVPSYWDWNLEARGKAYDCKSLKPLDPKEIATSCTCCYPDYISICNHCWHYYPHYWEGCGCIPIWWEWHDWWSFPWHNHWWLWWWYSHEGYPYPPFIDVTIINLIPPPSVVIIDFFGPLLPPIYILPRGVPSINQWIDAINKALGGNRSSAPFLPSDSVIKIIDILNGEMPKTGTDRPHGKPGNQHPRKPSHPLDTPASGSATVPTIPNVTMPLHTPQNPQTLTAPIPPPPNAIPPTDIVPTPPQNYPQEPQYYPQGGDYYPQEPQYYPREPQYYPQGGWGGDHRGGDNWGGSGHHGGDNWGGSGHRGGDNWGGSGHHGGDGEGKGHRGGNDGGHGHRGGDDGGHGHRGGDGTDKGHRSSEGGGHNGDDRHRKGDR